MPRRPRRGRLEARGEAPDGGNEGFLVLRDAASRLLGMRKPSPDRPRMGLGGAGTRSWRTAASTASAGPFEFHRCAKSGHSREELDREFDNRRSLRFFCAKMTCGMAVESARERACKAYCLTVHFFLDEHSNHQTSRLEAFRRERRPEGIAARSGEPDAQHPCRTRLGVEHGRCARPAGMAHTPAFRGQSRDMERFGFRQLAHHLRA